MTQHTKNPIRWLIDNDDAHAGFASALKEAGHPHTSVDILPFVRQIEGRVGHIAQGEKLFLRGPLGFKEICQEKGWDPIVWTGPEISETRLKESYKERYLNTYSLCLSLQSLIDDVPTPYKDMKDIFIKPVADNKAFPGQVVRVSDLRAWVEKMLKSGYVEASVLQEEVLIAPVQVLGCEWRLFIVDGQISDGCCYRQYQKIMYTRWVPEAVVEFVRHAISIYNPLPGYVMDIVQIEDGSYRIIEINTLNYAGIYACDAAKIVKSVNVMLEKSA